MTGRADPIRLRVMRQLGLTTLREYLRSPEAVFWTYGFPVLMAVVLGLAFGESGPEPVPVAVVQSEAASAFAESLADNPWIELQVLEEREAAQRLESGRVALVLSGTPAQPILETDAQREESRLALLTVEDSLQKSAGRVDVVEPVIEQERGTTRRYIDFLIPGLIGLNLLGAGMWGVGFNIVDMRIKNLLRRLIVAPMRRSEFLLAILLTRLGLALLSALLFLAFGVLVYGVPVRGSWFALLAVLVAGGLASHGLGLLTAARPTTIEGMSGMMNLIMLPMWLMSGTFFDVANFPDAVQPLIHALPLTHTNDAIRAVMLDGEGLAGVWQQMAYLGIFAVVTFALALRWFRWK